MKPQIEARDNQVMIEGHLMTRPRRIARSEWMEFWDRAMRGDAEIKDESYQEGYDQGYQDGEEDGSR